jgi:hypothetical protein
MAFTIQWQNLGNGQTVTYGTGSPQGSLAGSPGDLAIASDTGIIFTKATGAGTNTGWVVPISGTLTTNSLVGKTLTFTNGFITGFA